MTAIYLDHAATTPLHPDVLAVMYDAYQDIFGNPSSVHSFGRQARQSLDEARRMMANSIHANEREIILTSGGTESDNLALIGTALANQDKGKHIITSTQEHHATLYAAKHLENIGFHVTYIPVDEDGLVCPNDIAEALTSDTIIVSIMSVNNETGVIQPVEAIGKLLQEHDVYFHTDAVQAFGQLHIDVQAMGIDLLTVSSHKINGPKGIGFLYVREGIAVKPLQYGGEQERKRRPGTENIVSAIGFQKAIELALKEKHDRETTYKRYKEQFLQTLHDEGIEFVINGDPQATVPTIINISFPTLHVETLLTNFDLEGIAASSGSACTAGSVEPSHVLSAMFGKNNERTMNSIRFSFGLHNTIENVEEAARRIAQIIQRLKNS